MRSKTEQYQVVVCGGGMAGVSAAVSAARLGAKTCLIQDRPVFGGNSSSEIRVVPNGSARYHAYARETGIINELLIEERARSSETTMENGGMNSVWDMAIYDLAVSTPGLTVHLNTAVTDIAFDGDAVKPTVEANPSLGFLHRPACNPSRRIAAIICGVAHAETVLRIEGDVFIDCTGDGLVADLAGCEWRMGSESREEVDEPHAPERASKNTMGSSIHFRARDTGKPCPYSPPAWAVKHDNADFFYKRGRTPDRPEGGFWWIEIGVPWDTIHDNENIRHELTRHALGVWDWMKNRDEKLKAQGIERFALEWIGHVPGKRESRRIMGRHLLTEHDLLNRTPFEDQVAYGGWYVDLHTPGGLLAEHSELLQAGKASMAYRSGAYVGPYAIPLRSLISKDIDNLMMAGRNVSATHAALGSIRVMGTCAGMGQGAGTAAAVACREGVNVCDVPERAELMRTVQRELQKQDCFIPDFVVPDPANVATLAIATVSSTRTVAGVSPDDTWLGGGVDEWRNHPSPAQGGEDFLKQRLTQWIGVSTPRVDKLEMCLTNTSEKPTTVRARLFAVDSIWDYRDEPATKYAETTLSIPPGERQWIAWPVNAAIKPGGYVRVDLDANPDLIWHRSLQFIPAHIAGFESDPGKLRRYRQGVTLSYRIAPPQQPFAAEQVLTGVTRPHRSTNSWRSDPAAAMPQWLELSWDKPMTLRQVDVTFVGALLLEHRAYPPLYRDPQCVRDYQIQIWDGEHWQDAAVVTGNYQRRRLHTLDRPHVTKKVRVLISATNGDPSAAIYEVRCYE
ncbi:hypothetical protein BH10PLA1_BH10PLA1_21370 [soil metagenome]